jgi:glycosyltransferase involved in cell wall biosynthesis
MPRRLLHVVQIGFFQDSAGRSPAELLEAWPSLVDVAEAASCSGVRVSVVQASSGSEILPRNGVLYHFVPFGDPASRHGQAALRELTGRLAPDIFHVHGLHFPHQVASLAAAEPNVPIVLQDHASKPPPPWRRRTWRQGMSAAAGIAFCALEQAQPFIKAGVVDRATQLYQIPESTSRFSPGAREEARRITAVEGDPAVLWVGHLDANKDPLTVLEGVAAAASGLPQLRLYCCFGGTTLLRPCQDRIATDARLCGRVHLLGAVAHERIELLMRAADIFVLGSHREGSGYSLIEALACGLPPVVTDIPSFRALTGGGAVGRLWPCADPPALCEALRSVAGASGPAARAGVRAHFDRELSFAALGKKLVAMYEDALMRKCGARSSTMSL